MRPLRGNVAEQRRVAVADRIAEEADGVWWVELEALSDPELVAQTVQRFADVETSNGARFDANLYPHDFNGAHLNSLGRAKVLLMLQDCETCEPIIIHLVDAGEGDVEGVRS